MKTRKLPWLLLLPLPALVPYALYSLGSGGPTDHTLAAVTPGQGTELHPARLDYIAALAAANGKRVDATRAGVTWSGRR